MDILPKSAFFLMMMVFAMAVDQEDAMQPQQRNTLSNYRDCPGGRRIYDPPGPILCPEGTRPRGPPLSSVRLTAQPCPPWVDERGDCQVGDRTLERSACLSRFSAFYQDWRRNANRPTPAGPPGSSGGGSPGGPPSPPCVPA